jgi:protein SCO1/2
MKRVAILLGMLLMGGLILAGCSQEYTGTVLEPPKAVDFTAQTDDGESFTLSENTDQITVLYFGYTHCPDICPTTLYEVNRAMDELGRAASDVQVAMFTVDPDRDTAEQLDKYLGNINESFIGLRVESPEDQATIMQQFGAWAEIEPSETDSADAYLVTHSTQLFVINQHSELRVVISYGTSAKDIAADLRKVLQDES